MAMVATAFPHGLTEDEARWYLDRLFNDEEGYREQAVADLTGLIRSNLSKQAEEKEMIMATKEVKAAERGEARGGMRIAKPQLAALIMTAAGVAIVFSISMFAVIARPLFVVAALLGRVRQEAKIRQEPKEAPSGESPVGPQSVSKP
jgi:hypothetical protein